MNAAVMGAAEEKEISDGINALSDKRYGSHEPETLKKLFLSYDKNGDGGLDSDELYELLADADVSSWPIRKLYVSGIIDKLDKSPTDGRVTWEEYLAARSAPKPTTPASPGAPPKTTTPAQTPLYCSWETNICNNDPATGAVQQASVSPTMWAIPIGLSIGMVWLLTRK